MQIAPCIRALASALLALTFACAIAAPHAFTVVLKNGKVQGENTLKVRKGEQVELKLSSDQPVVLHLHGYELMATVTPPQPALLSFKADIAGRFPVHEHREGPGNHRAVLFVEVHP